MFWPEPPEFQVKRTPPPSVSEVALSTPATTAWLLLSLLMLTAR